jgi:HEAT repeat protein
MALTTARVAAGRVQLLAAFRDPMVRLVVNGQAQTQQASNVAGELARGFLVELTPQGQAIGVYMQPDAAKFSQDFVRTLLATVQFVFPATPPADGQSWTVREEDRGGTYLARYRIVSASVAGHPDWIELHKSKLRYLPEAAGAVQPIPGRAQAQKKQVPKMNLAARFDLQTGALASLAGTETQDTFIQDKPVAHSETEVHLSRLSNELVPAEEMERVRQLSASLIESSSSLPLFARRSAADVEANVQRSELGSATVKELLDNLAALKTNSLGREQQQAAETPLYLKFKALIYVHPESCAQLEPVLETADPSSPAFRIIAGALEAVGHARAQRSLVHAIQARPRDSAALSNLIAALGSVPQPTVETEKAIREVAASSPDSNTSGTAFLALGSMAKNLSGKDPLRASAIVSFLLQRAAAARSEEQTQHLLQALGNTGSSGAMLLLSQFASNPSPVLRAAAVDALRSIRQPGVDPLLVHVLASDTDPHVRLEAAFALGFRRPSRQSYDAQKTALAAEADEKVRAALLNNLAKMRPRFPEVRSVLEESAAKDPSEYVRKAAAGLLQQTGTSSPK